MAPPSASPPELFVAANRFLFGAPIRRVAEGKSRYSVPVVFAPKTAKIEDTEVFYTIKSGGMAVSGSVPPGELTAASRQAAPENYMKELAHFLPRRQSVHFQEHFMTISIGDKLPDATFKVRVESEYADKTTDDVFAGKKVVLFGLPGAFTPTCSMNHLPGFLENRDVILSKGVDEIAVVAVNDHHVMKAWSEATRRQGQNPVPRRRRGEVHQGHWDGHRHGAAWAALEAVFDDCRGRRGQAAEC